MKLAILYAGQGSQHPGMGKDLYERYPAFREAFNAADLDFDLESVCFDDPEGGGAFVKFFAHAGVLGTLTGIQNSKFHRSCLHSAVNSSISSRTVYIRSSRPTLAPQKNSPSSTLPFTASMRAWVMQ